MKRSLVVAALAAAVLVGTVAPDLSAQASSSATCRGAVSWQRATSVEGSVATLTGKVVGTKFAASSNGSPTFLDIGRPYPDPSRLTIVIWIENRAAFGRPEIKYLGKTVCVRGLVSDYAGSPEVIATSPSQITLKR